MSFGSERSISPAPAESPRALRGRFSDFDEITEWIPDFESEYVQLRRGPVASTLTRVALDRLTLIRFDEEMPAYAFRAAAPENAVTLAFAAAPAPTTVWRGAAVTDRTLLVYGPGAEHVGRSHGRLRSVGLHIAVGALEQHAARLGLDVSFAPGASHALDPAAGVLDGLRSAVQQVFAIAESAQPLLEFRELRLREEETILGAAVRAVVRADPRGDDSPASHERAVRRAVEALEARPEEPLYLADLCDAAAVSERTLRNAFQRIYGVSPIRYLHQYRMGQVRRMLRDADPTRSRVSEIAQRFGFSNLGRFAVEFRELFGESPSALLRR